MRNISIHRSALMGFAALWIYYFHIVPVELFSRGQQPSELAIYFHGEGFCGVDIFLLVSSFGLAYAFQKERVTDAGSYRKYLVRRFSRIYTVLLPTALVIGLVDNWSLREFFGRITGLRQLWIDVYDFLWFVPCILLFYLLAPFYYALFYRARRKGTFTLVAIVLMLAINFALRNVARYDLYGILTRIPVFLLGFYFGHLSIEDKKLTACGTLGAVVCLMAGLWYSFCLSQQKTVWLLPAYNAQVNLFIAPSIALVLANLCQLAKESSIPEMVKRIGRGIYAVFGFFGAISFEFYVVQEWVWLKVCNSSTLQALLGSSMERMQAGCFLLTLVGAVGLHWVAGRLSHPAISRKTRKC